MFGAAPASFYPFPARSPSARCCGGGKTKELLHKITIDDAARGGRRISAACVHVGAPFHVVEAADPVDREPRIALRASLARCPGQMR